MAPAYFGERHDTDHNTQQPIQTSPMVSFSYHSDFSNTVPGMLESDLQKLCIKWCEYAIKSGVVYWATSNERKAKPQHMAALRLMGMRPGVADLTYLYNDNGIKLLFVELKRPTTYKMGKRGKKIINQRGGTQSPGQIVFQADVEAVGANYHLIDNLDDFIALMKQYNLVRRIK